MKISINKITIGKVATATFVISSGIYIGNYLSGILIQAPIKAIDRVLAKKLKDKFDTLEKEMLEDNKEDVEDE